MKAKDAEHRVLRNKDTGYLFNAFGISYARETRDQAIETGDKVLKALAKFQGDNYFSDFVRNTIREAVAGDPELKRALLLHEMLKQPLDRPILFEDFFGQIRSFWGDIGLDQDDIRHIKTDQSLREEREITAHVDAQKLEVVGIVLHSTAGAAPSPRALEEQVRKTGLVQQAA